MTRTGPWYSRGEALRYRMPGDAQHTVEAGTAHRRGPAPEPQPAHLPPEGVWEVGDHVRQSLRALQGTRPRWRRCLTARTSTACGSVIRLCCPTHRQALLAGPRPPQIHRCTTAVLLPCTAPPSTRLHQLQRQLGPLALLLARRSRRLQGPLLALEAAARGGGRPGRCLANCCSGMRCQRREAFRKWVLVQVVWAALT